MADAVHLRVLIADDEALGRERLRQLLQAEPGVEIVGECADGVETLKAIRQRAPHLVLLDVRMPDLDGFGVLSALGPETLPAVVFVTAHEEFALRGFEVSAVDYLLKPVDRERFRNALDRVRESLRAKENQRAAQNVAAVLADLRARTPPCKRLTVRSTGRVSLVPVDEIDWIRGADNYAELHVGARRHLLRQTLTALERQLPATQFVRISRSLLVNLDRIQELRPRSHGDYLVILRDGTRLVASRNYRLELQRLLGKAA